MGRQHMLVDALLYHKRYPGLGGSVVDWITYRHAVQTTSDRSNFGKGDVRGAIGPESANNAKEGLGLDPTLLFGIPGPGSMAIFIGAIALLGSGQIEIGPAMLTNNLYITYAVVWLLALANMVGTLICIPASGGIAFALFDAVSIPSFSRVRVFPMFVASVSLLGCAFLIARMMLNPGIDTIFTDLEKNGVYADAAYRMWSH
ncbi:MAG: tripartite tricarboxylate transporter permease [Tateyamaria sp.]